MVTNRPQQLQRRVLMLQRERPVDRLDRLPKPTDREVDPCKDVVGTPVARRGGRPRFRARKCLRKALLHHEAFGLSTRIVRWWGHGAGCDRTYTPALGKNQNFCTRRLASSSSGDSFLFGADEKGLRRAMSKF
jgi:hypothetical protein